MFDYVPHIFVYGYGYTTTRHYPQNEHTKKSEFMFFKQDGATLNGKSLKLADEFTYLGSNISFTESDVHIRIEKALTAIDRFLNI